MVRLPLFVHVEPFPVTVTTAPASIEPPVDATVPPLAMFTAPPTLRFELLTAPPLVTLSVPGPHTERSGLLIHFDPAPSTVTVPVEP